MEQFLQKCIDNLKKYKLTRDTKGGQFLISVLAELQKVTWPSFEEVKNSTMVTLLVMLVMSVYMGFAQVFITLLYKTIKQIL